jgi:hypothetical protein
MGMENAELEAYQLPVLVIPGNDKTHASVNGIAAAALIPNSELFQLPIEDQDIDLIHFPMWKDYYPQMADKFHEFMQKHLQM